MSLNDFSYFYSWKSAFCMSLLSYNKYSLRWILECESKILLHRYFNDFNKATILNLWFSLIMYGFWLFLFLYKSYSHNYIFDYISLIAPKWHQIHINNQEKLTTRSSKLKVNRVNSQAISSYPLSFSTDILFFFFSFFCFLSSCFFVCLFFCFFKLKIHILIHIQPCGRVSVKNFSHGWFPETRPLFLSLGLTESQSWYNMSCWLRNSFSEKDLRQQPLSNYC